jgi:hypothetical protein
MAALQTDYEGIVKYYIGLALINSEQIHLVVITSSVMALVALVALFLSDYARSSLKVSLRPSPGTSPPSLCFPITSPRLASLPRLHRDQA